MVGIYDEKMSDGTPKRGEQRIDSPTHWYPRNSLPPKTGHYLVKVTEIDIRCRWFNGSSKLWECEVPFTQWTFIPD